VNADAGDELAMGKDVVLTESDNGRRVEVTEGQMVVVRLAENPTTGYRWAIEELTGPLTVVREGSERVDPARRGAGGVRILAFATKGPGRGEVSLALRRSGTSEPAERFQCSIDSRKGET
jgi:inhibitor of cysteine peptidase